MRFSLVRSNEAWCPPSVDNPLQHGKPNTVQVAALAVCIVPALVSEGTKGTVLRSDRPRILEFQPGEPKLSGKAF